MAKNRYLKRPEFRQYLAAHKDEVVGVTRDSQACPISSFLADETRRTWNVSTLACVPQVDAESGEDQFNLNHEFRPPRWARDFIFAVDYYFGRKHVSITGADALYVLDEAVR